jgi:hypothetical protein
MMSKWNAFFPLNDVNAKYAIAREMASQTIPEIQTAVDLKLSRARFITIAVSEQHFHFEVARREEEREHETVQYLLEPSEDVGEPRVFIRESSNSDHRLFSIGGKFVLSVCHKEIGELLELMRLGGHEGERSKDPHSYLARPTPPTERHEFILSNEEVAKRLRNATNGMIPVEILTLANPRFST